MRYLVTGLIALLLVSPVCVFAKAEATTSKKVLVLLDRGFNRTEYWVPSDILREAGYEVVVASKEAGRVPSRLDGAVHERDEVAQIAMSDVGVILGYDALFIPGGYSPRFLEKDANALRLVEAFLDAGKPVAAICHGPRLLMAVGRLDDRVTTMLHKVASERPGWWKDGRAGAYLDQPVVIDDNLITARYPGDASALGEAILNAIEGNRPEVPQFDSSTAYLALWPGFDEAVVLGLLPNLQAGGRSVAVIAPEPGWVRGLHEYPIPVDFTYGSAPEVKIAIAPGGLWPKPLESGEGKEAGDPELAYRNDWIRSVWESGGRILLVGFDSELISKWEKVAEGEVAASEQLRWAFGKNGLRWVENPLVETAPGLWTASGSGALGEILNVAVPSITAGPLCGPEETATE